jgi:hypothetical protein
MDSCAKHAGPRVQHSRLIEISFRVNVRALIKGGILPVINHFDLLSRDRLCDIVRGTPLEKMATLVGWWRVDTSKKPTVPRGLVEGLFDSALLDKEQRAGCTHLNGKISWQQHKKGCSGFPSLFCSLVFVFPYRRVIGF